jgi:hypothetical protein
MTTADTLNRMGEIVKEIRRTGVDVDLVQELIFLASDFEGMTKRRMRLIAYLDHLSTIKQQAAKERWQSKIQETVSEFSSEISNANWRLLSGGSASQ